MRRYRPIDSSILNVKQRKEQVERKRKDSQISQKGRPVKAVNAHTSGDMGNILRSCMSTEESRESSHGRHSRSSEKNISPVQRSNSLQRNPTNHSVISPGWSTSSSASGNGTATYTRSDSTRNGSTLGGVQFNSTASGYLYNGAAAGIGATSSFGDRSLKERTMRHEHQSPSASAGSSNYALIHTFATKSSSSDVNFTSNGRQSRTVDRTGTNRLRSASQGLRNLGNTCYMNSVLQCLAKVPWFKDKSSLKHDDDLLNEFFSLMKKMQENESESSLDPYYFRKQIGALGIRFSSSEQNDAHEFLLCLLSRLSKALKREGKSDVVADFLLGKQQNVIRFKDCKHVLNNDQPFFSLLLPLTEDGGKSVSRNTTVDLKQCLKNYTKKEDVDGDALCMDCLRMQLCSIEASFKYLPKFLVIYLKRYDFMKAEKLDNKVNFPLEDLRMTQKPTGEDSGSEEVAYDLIGVCNHYGSLRFGHYTADIKSPSNNWYNYSDSRVTKTEISSTSRDAYILFYQQRPN